MTLVRQRVDASGLSLRDFAQTRGIKYGTLRRYYDKNLPPLLQGLKPNTLKDLATALDVPLSEVQRAADQSIGRIYEQQVGDKARVLIASLRELTPEQRQEQAREVLAMVQELLEEPS